MTNFRLQKGNVLIVSLLMLVIMTTLVVSSMGGSTISQKIVGNMQNQRSAEATAQATIQQALAQPSLFLSAEGSSLTKSLDGWSVSVSTLYLGCPCGGSLPVDNSEDAAALATASATMACWDVMAAIKDNSQTGTQVTVHQGIRRNQECPG